MGTDAEKAHFSFDVFDTSICRLLHLPEHLHFIVGIKLRKRGIINLSGTAWMIARSRAEFQRRLMVSHSEVTLNEIYVELRRSLGLSEEDARLALRAELEEEERLVRPIAATRKYVEELAQTLHPIIFVSDTYFTRKQVETLLIKCGYNGPLDIVASCEERKSKSLGSLYKHVAEQKGTNGATFRHLGDNPVSDEINARASGWHAEIFTDSHWTARERVLFAAGRLDFLGSCIAGSARAARLGQEDPVNPGILTASASVVGPLFGAYVLWVLLDAIERGARSLHFLARDGQVLVPICKRLAKWLGADIEVRYTYASRQAFLLAALPEDDHEAMVERALELGYYEGITLVEMLTSLRFDQEEAASVIHRSGLSPNSISASLDEDQRAALMRALLVPEVRDALGGRVRQARKAALAYLEAEGMFSAPEACIVDLGWRGNTQKRLKRVVDGRVEFVGYYLGLSNTVLDSEDKTRVWMTTENWKTSLLEVMASADHTSVKGFALAEDGRTPVCSPPLTEDPILVPWGARYQQAISLRFIEYLTDAVELAYFSPQEVYEALKIAALASYRHFRLSPTWEEAEAYGGLLHQEDINHLERRELAGLVTNSDFVRLLFDKRARAKASRWFEGSLARSKGSLLPALLSRGIDRMIEAKARLETKRKRRALRHAAEKELGALGWHKTR